MRKIRTLSQFAERYGLPMFRCEDCKEDELRGPTGVIVSASCPCGGCFSVHYDNQAWDSEFLYSLPFPQISAGGHRAFPSFWNGSVCLFSPNDREQVKLAFKLTGIFPYRTARELSKCWKSEKAAKK